jgi:hypothetical protein
MATKGPGKPAFKFVLRVPLALKQRLWARAEKDRRSINSEILTAVEKWLEQGEGKERRKR